MDPSNKTTPNFEVPSPAIEPVPLAAGSGDILPSVSEQPPAAAEKVPTPGPLAATPPPTIPLPVPPAAAATDDVAATTPAPTPVADDDDKGQIEKVWVDKVKQIVDHTRDDPHKQSQELTVFKADYMKKRYGKTIKISP